MLGPERAGTTYILDAGFREGGGKPHTNAWVEGVRAIYITTLRLGSGASTDAEVMGVQVTWVTLEYGCSLGQIKYMQKTSTSPQGGVRKLCRGTKKYMQKTSTKPRASGNYVEEPENTCKKQVQNLRGC